MVIALALGAAPAILGFAGAIVAPRRTVALVGLGLLLALALVAYAYFSAPSSANQSNCSDCGEYLGRWWEPWLAGWLAGILFAGWCAGVLLGALLRRVVVQRSSHARA